MTAPDPLTISELSLRLTGADGQTRTASVRLADLGTVEERRLRGAAADAEAGSESRGEEAPPESSSAAETLDATITISRPNQQDTVLDTVVSSDWELGPGPLQELAGYLSEYLDGASPGSTGPERAVGPT